MGRLSKLRAWLNRDDGRLFQVGNERIGVLTTVGGLGLVAALILWQLHKHTGVDTIWTIAAGVIGFVLFAAGVWREERG